jgi:transcriptional regulator with XRE-family HTH domain
MPGLEHGDVLGSFPLAKNGAFAAALRDGSSLQSTDHGHYNESAVCYCACVPAASNDYARYFGARLQRLRGNTGLSQEAFAREIGVCRNQITAYECGRNSPALHRLPMIADVLGVSFDELLGDSTPEPIDSKGERRFLHGLISRAPIEVLRLVRPVLLRLLPPTG